MESKLTYDSEAASQDEAVFQATTWQQAEASQIIGVINRIECSISLEPITELDAWH